MGRVVHFEIHCDDLDRAERFYSDVFGWTITHWEHSPIDYRLISTGPDDEPGINGALSTRDGAIDNESIVAYRWRPIRRDRLLTAFPAQPPQGEGVARGPAADRSHKAMRTGLTLTGNGPRRVGALGERRRPEPPPLLASRIVLAHQHDRDQHGP